MSDATTVIRQADEGERWWFAGGGVFTWKVTGAESGGAFLLFEDHMARGKTTPLHTHPNQDETIYVLSGEILVHVDGADHPVGAGGVAFAPRGVAHAFMVTSESARILALQTPGDGERFYRDAGEPADADTDPERTDWERLGAVAARSDSIEILGPAPFPAVAA